MFGMFRAFGIHPQGEWDTLSDILKHAPISVFGFISQGGDMKYLRGDGWGCRAKPAERREMTYTSTLGSSPLCRSCIQCSWHAITLR